MEIQGTIRIHTWREDKLHNWYKKLEGCDITVFYFQCVCMNVLNSPRVAYRAQIFKLLTTRSPIHILYCTKSYTEVKT